MPLGINGTRSAPGYRDYGRTGYEGIIRRGGYSGYSWSSATGGIGGLDLNFYSQSLTASRSDSRAYGFQLRCLSE
ncbi:hypothetical protein [uncultured Rikenella sp.]|uniref:hypothetical protein n=1 Tax=uncultured Rikenella sp. TaxID=368003 RepID=UPI0025FA7579|nr:hypothetical protein [uncultured Rikenella sp.]